VPDRAAAVIVGDGRVLLMLRHQRGRSYAVLPGGGIEPGESARQAVVRELAEETSLVAGSVEQLWVREDDDRRAVYFRMTHVSGTPTLGGEELLRAGEENRYRLYWASADELEELGFEPHGLIGPLRALLGPSSSSS